MRIYTDVVRGIVTTMPQELPTREEKLRLQFIGRQFINEGSPDETFDENADVTVGDVQGYRQYDLIWDTSVSPVDLYRCFSAAAGEADWIKTSLDPSELGALSLLNKISETELTTELAAKVNTTDEEIETAYNNQVAVATEPQIKDRTNTSVYRITPQRVHQAVDVAARSVMSNVATQTSEYTAQPADDYIISVDTTSGNVIVNLPAVVGVYKVKNVGSNNVIITPTTWTILQHNNTYGTTFILYPGETVDLWADEPNQHWEF